MPIEKLDAEVVLQSNENKRLQSYPVRSKDGHRLVPFAQVGSSPTFRFAQDAKIFTTGSCFARNVERSLTRSGYEVTSSSGEFHNPFPERSTFQRYNKFTIASILNEIKWALGEEEMNCEKLLCEARPKQFCDLQTSGDALRTSFDEMSKFRKTYNETFAPVGDADIVILTLGLVECWYDKVAEVHLNAFPGLHAIKSHPGRFEFHVLDYEEIYKSLIETYDTIAAHNAKFRMLVTVSPVPLDRTFRDMDVLVANTYSKAVQRAAVEAFVKDRPADYFPSFEAVTLSDTKFAWSDTDLRHVRGETVDRIIGRVLEDYTELTETQSAQKTVGFVTAYLASNDTENAERVLSEHKEIYGLSISLMLPEAEVRFRKGELKSATEVLRDLIKRLDSRPEEAAEALENRAAQVRQKANELLLTCERLQSGGRADASEMEKQRAGLIIQRALEEDSDNAELAWLRDYFERLDTTKTDSAEKQKNETYLQEISAVSRFRTAVRSGDVEGAQTIAKKAEKEIGFSEIVLWELAILSRDNGDLEEAFDAFSRIGRFGGSKSVPAVRNAVRLGTKLGRESEVADLAEDVLKAIN